MACNARRASVMLCIVVSRSNLAVAVICYSKHVSAVGIAGYVYNVVVIVKLDTAYTVSLTAHWTYFVFVKANHSAASCSEKNLIRACCKTYADNFIVFVDADAADTALTRCVECIESDTLYDTLLSREEYVSVRHKVRHVNHSGNAFTAVKLEKVYKVSTLCISRAFRHVIALELEDSAEVCEEEEIIVCGRCEYSLCHVLFACCHACYAAAASALSTVCCSRYTLDVAEVCKCEYTLFFLDEVFDIKVVFNEGDFCASFVCKLSLDFCDFCLDNIVNKLRVGKDFDVFVNLLEECIQFILNLFNFKTLQAAESHIEDGLCLDFGKTEALHKTSLCIVVACTDDMDNFVDVVAGNLEAFEDMSAFASLLKVVFRSACHNLELMVKIRVEHFAECENLRLIVYKSQHIHRESCLQICILEKLIEDNLSVYVATKLDYDTHTFAVTFVTEVCDAFDTLVTVKLGNMLDKTSLVDHIWNFCNDNAVSAVCPFFDFALGAHLNLALTCVVSRSDAALAENESACREVRTLDNLAKVVCGSFRMVDEIAYSIDDFAEVVRWDVSCHTNSDTHSAVDEKVREAGWKHSRLLHLVVEVRLIVDSFLVDICQHFVGKTGHSRFCVTVSSRWVAVDRAEVTMAVDEHIAHGEVLRKTYHCIVNRCVAVWMITAENVTYSSCRLTVRLVKGKLVFVHSVENTSVYRLEAISCIRKSTGYDNAHCVIDEGFLHFAFKIDCYDLLIGKTKVLFLVITHVDLFLFYVYGLKVICVLCAVGADDQWSPLQYNVDEGNNISCLAL